MKKYDRYKILLLFIFTFGVLFFLTREIHQNNQLKLQLEQKNIIIETYQKEIIDTSITFFVSKIEGIRYNLYIYYRYGEQIPKDSIYLFDTDNIDLTKNNKYEIGDKFQLKKIK